MSKTANAVGPVSEAKLCQNCLFYDQCNKNPTRLHSEDSE